MRWLARMQNSDKPVVAERRGALGTPTLSGSLLALLFWWQSLTPTLIPRSWETQTVIGAICLAIGYGIGTLAGRTVHRLLERWGCLPGNVLRRHSGTVLAAAWLVTTFLGATLWLGWQNQQRSFMGMVPVVWWEAVAMSAFTPFAGWFLVVVGRVMANGIAATKRFIAGHVPQIVSVPVTALLIVGVGALGRGVALPALTAAANSRHA